MFLELESDLLGLLLVVVQLSLHLLSGLVGLVGHVLSVFLPFSPGLVQSQLFLLLLTHHLLQLSLLLSQLLLQRPFLLLQSLHLALQSPHFTQLFILSVPAEFDGLFHFQDLEGLLVILFLASVCLLLDLLALFLGLLEFVELGCLLLFLPEIVSE